MPSFANPLSFGALAQATNDASMMTIKIFLNKLISTLTTQLSKAVVNSRLFATRLLPTHIVSPTLLVL